MLMFKSEDHYRLLRHAKWTGRVEGLAWALTVWMIGTLVNAAYGQEIESVRQTQYEWECKEQDGDRVSGHTRQDKAFQSCINLALANPQTPYFVEGGTYRIIATGDAPAPEPPPPPDPDPDPPPVPSDAVTFGPVDTPTTYPKGIGALAQDFYTWRITFELNGVGARQGLASRDQSGQLTAGHLGIWVMDNGRVRVRNQDAEGGGSNVVLVSQTVFAPGTEYTIAISGSDEGLGLWVGDVLEDSSPVSYGLTGSDLDLVLGGLCNSCLPDDSVPPGDPIDGTVYLEIHDDPLPLPAPVGSLTMTWRENLVREDDTPMTRNELAGYQVRQNGREIADLDNETWQYEISGLMPGEHCFTVSAQDTDGQYSDPGGPACGVVP